MSEIAHLVILADTVYGSSIFGANTNSRERRSVSLQHFRSSKNCFRRFNTKTTSTASRSMLEHLFSALLSSLTQKLQGAPPEKALLQ